jgi:hypothetical protein
MKRIYAGRGGIGAILPTSVGQESQAVGSVNILRDIRPEDTNGID